MSQTDKVIKHLNTGNTISRLEAGHLFNIVDLPKIISLAKKTGIKINHERKKDVTGRNYMRYSVA
tara:strand:- start:1201 stop:1395 length:195 start_codon:yes stop_codon:yes gene_type:complete